MSKKSTTPISQITKFYLTNFLKHQQYFFPIIVLFYQANHLTYWEIFLLYSVKSVVFVLLEIPSGIIADFVGKNNANIFARFMIVPALLIFVVADSFWMFFWANILLNIGDVFKSGTHKAIIFDYLKDHPEIRKTYPQLIGETKVFSRIGEGIASLIGAIIASMFGYKMVFLLSAIPAALNFLNALSYEKIKEPYAEKKRAFNANEYSKQLKEAIRFLKNNPALLFLMMNSSIIFFSWSVSMIILQPYLARMGMPVQNFGIIYLCILLVAALASKYSSAIGNLVGIKKAIGYFGWLIIIPFFLLGQKSDMLVLLFSFVSINFIKSAYHPIMIGEIAKKANTDKRATILSIAAMFSSILYLISLPLTGYILDASNIYAIMEILAVILLLNQLTYSLSSFIFRKNKTYENTEN